MYDYGIIDAQYILVRNRHLQTTYAENHRINTPGLLKLTMQSIMKLKRDYEFKYPLLMWDKQPYFRMAVLPEYKSDRWVPTEEERIECEAILNSPTASFEEKEIAKNQINKIDQEVHNYEVQQEVKEIFTTKMNDMGFKSLIKPGFEADDLAYLCACHVAELGKTGVLLSADTDWINFSNDNVEFISCKNGSKYPEDKEFSNQHIHVINNDLYAYGILTELYWGGHNNIGGYSNNYELDEFLSKVYFNTDLPDDLVQVRKYYEAMDIRSHYNDIESEMLNLFSDNKVNPNLISNFMTTNAIFINFSSYKEFVKDYESF